MTDYISREAAKEAVRNALSFHSYAGGTAANAIDKIPAADVRPVVRGKWERIEPNDHYDFRCVCSNCRKYWVFSEDKYDFNFCPKCGASMVGVGE